MLKFVLRNPQFLYYFIESYKLFFICYIIISHLPNFLLLFFFRQIFILITLILTLFLFCLFRKIFISVSGIFLPLFCFRKILVPFTSIFLKLLFVSLFLGGFFIIFSNYFYICIQKNYEKMFNSY